MNLWPLRVAPWVVIGFAMGCFPQAANTECVQDVDCGPGLVCTSEGACHADQTRSPVDVLTFICIDTDQIPLNYVCNGRNDCCDGADEENCPQDPPDMSQGWTCHGGYYARGDGCDCGCGLWDPDCPKELGIEDCETINCEESDSLEPEETLDPDDPTRCLTQAPVDPVPSGWTCTSTYYGTGDGCDCGCGVVDPDCECGAEDPECALANPEEICEFSYCQESVDPTDITACQGNTNSTGCSSCPNGDIIPRDFLCDGFADCQFGEDEMGCPD
jgi:hypothetical protein